MADDVMFYNKIFMEQFEAGSATAAAATGPATTPSASSCWEGPSQRPNDAGGDLKLQERQDSQDNDPQKAQEAARAAGQGFIEIAAVSDPAVRAVTFQEPKVSQEEPQGQKDFKDIVLSMPAKAPSAPAKAALTVKAPPPEGSTVFSRLSDKG